MSPRYDDEWISTMLDTKRRLGPVTPAELLVTSGLRDRDTVVDVGCGPGFLTMPAARVVGPRGLVYAVDVEQKMLDLVSRNASDGGLQNVVTVLSSGQRIPLEDRIADYAICGLLIHDRPDFAGKVEMARDVGRLVRPEGRVLVIEWVPQEDDDLSRRLPSDETEEVLREAGFEFDGSHPLGDRQYMIVAKPAST